jgi:lipoyl(octanoyl) transferase
MAMDEAVLEAVAAGTAPPTLRLYGWDGAWLSIGMSQPITDVDEAAVAAAGVGVLRRPSGGTAVLHVDQLGWSLALPLGHPLAPGDIIASYLAQSRLTIDALGRIGVSARPATVDEARAPLPDPVLAIACFGGLAPHEVVVGSPARKLVGWGQVRRRNVVMHHAVLSLAYDPGALPAYLVADRARLAAALDRRVVGLNEAAGHRVASQEFAEALVAAHAAAGLALEPGELTAAEVRRARALVAEKYGSDDWTRRR